MLFFIHQICNHSPTYHNDGKSAIGAIRHEYATISTRVVTMNLQSTHTDSSPDSSESANLLFFFFSRAALTCKLSSHIDCMDLKALPIQSTAPSTIKVWPFSSLLLVALYFTSAWSPIQEQISDDNLPARSIASWSAPESHLFCVFVRNGNKC